MTAVRARVLGGMVLVLLAAAVPPADATAAAAAAVVPAIAVRPNCGPVGPGQVTTAAGLRPTYAIEVIGRGLPAGQEADVIFDPGAAPQKYAGQIDGAGAIDQVIHPYAMPAGTYTVEVQPFTFNIDNGTVFGPVVSTVFQVPCPAPPPVSPSASP
ncbi:MAG TPA: hypothetical protein VGO86_10575, partial [Candidatus Dormibacteraeota bacterium]